MAASDAPDDLAIWCMMETPRAVLNAEAIAGAEPAGRLLRHGHLGPRQGSPCPHTRDRLPMVTSLGLCMLAARAFGLAILDGVHLDLDDDGGLRGGLPPGP